MHLPAVPYPRCRKALLTETRTVRMRKRSKKRNSSVRREIRRSFQVRVLSSSANAYVPMPTLASLSTVAISYVHLRFEPCPSPAKHLFASSTIHSFNYRTLVSTLPPSCRTMNEMNCVGNTGSPGFVKTRSTGSHFARNVPYFRLSTIDFIVSNSSAYCDGTPRLLKASTMHGKPFSRTRFPTLPALKQAASQASLMTSMHTHCRKSSRPTRAYQKFPQTASVACHAPHPPHDTLFSVQEACCIASILHSLRAELDFSRVLQRVFQAWVFVPLFSRQMFKGLGAGWASSLLGFVSIAAILVPFIFLKYRKAIRQRSKMCLNA